MSELCRYDTMTLCVGACRSCQTVYDSDYQHTLSECVGVSDECRSVGVSERRSAVGGVLQSYNSKDDENRHHNHAHKVQSMCSASIFG